GARGSILTLRARAAPLRRAVGHVDIEGLAGTDRVFPAARQAGGTQVAVDPCALIPHVLPRDDEPAPGRGDVRVDEPPPGAPRSRPDADAPPGSPFRTQGDDVDDAPRCLGTPHRGTGAPDDFDALHRGRGDLGQFGIAL